VVARPQYAAFISGSSNTPEWPQSEPIEVKVSSLIVRTEAFGRTIVRNARH
jgi:hypothetical protein